MKLGRLLGLELLERCNVGRVGPDKSIPTERELFIEPRVEFIKPRIDLPKRIRNGY
jgi:hypothetical protein